MGAFKLDPTVGPGDPAWWHTVAVVGVVWAAVLTFIVIPLVTIRWGKSIAHTFAPAERWLKRLETAFGIAGRKATCREWERIGFVFIALASVATIADLCGFQGPLGLYNMWVGTALAGAVAIGLYPFLGQRVWCRMWCPLAFWMNFWGRWSNFKITPEKGKCIDCNVCNQYCQMGIDIKSRALQGRPVTLQDSPCVGCAECVVRCPMEILHLGDVPAAKQNTLCELEMADENFGWTIEMQIKAARAGLRHTEIPVPYRNRIGTSTISGTISGTIKAGTRLFSREAIVRSWFSTTSTATLIALVLVVAVGAKLYPIVLTPLIFFVLAKRIGWRYMPVPAAVFVATTLFVLWPIFCETGFLTLAWFWLLGPTQDPWYWTWALPLLPFARSRAWLAVSGLVLLYYLRFWLSYHWPDTPVLGTKYVGYAFFDFIVTWLEFAPWLFCLTLGFVLRQRSAENNGSAVSISSRKPRTTSLCPSSTIL